MRMMKALIAILIPLLPAMAEEPAAYEFRRYTHFEFRKAGDSAKVTEREILVAGDMRASYHVRPGKLSAGIFLPDPTAATPSHAGHASRIGDTLVLDFDRGSSRFGPRRGFDPIRKWKFLDSDTALIEAVGARRFDRVPIPFPDQVTMDLIRFSACKQDCFEAGTQLLIDLIADPVAFQAGARPVIGKFYDWRDWLRTGGPSLDRAQVGRFRDLKAQARTAIDSLPDPKGFWARLKQNLKTGQWQSHYDLGGRTPPGR